MKKFLILFICVILYSLAYSQKEGVQIIVPVKDNFELKVKVFVSVDTSVVPPRFTFEYTLINLSTSGQPVELFDISPPFGEWVDTVIAPLQWTPVKKKSSWIANWKIEGLLPGDSLSGFIFITKKLPDISYWYAEGSDTINTPEIRGGPPYVGEEKWVRDSLFKIYYNKTPFGPGKYGYTVGPGPYPPMKPIWPWGHYPDSAFIHLRDRLSKCYIQGWVTHKTYERIWRGIGHAWEQLQHGRLEQSKRTLTRLMNTLERLREQQEIKDEAFYIFYYRTKYVRDNLWCRP